MSDINRQQLIEAYLKNIAGALDQVFQETFGKIGFALLLFDFNDPSIGNYISNTKREDMIKTLRETADRLEKNQDIPPATTTIQ